MDVVSNTPENVAQELWYRLLNCGFKLAISAGTDSFTNVADHYTPGGGRVYVHVDGPLENAAWITAYKQGRSFASNGPVIDFEVNGRGPGETLRFNSGRAGEVRVRARVRTNLPLEQVELVVNGVPQVSVRAAGDSEITIDKRLRLDSSAWLAVRALGQEHRLILNDSETYAHTSPVYVDFNGRPGRKPDDLRFYREWIEGLVRRVKERGRFATDARRQEVVDLFEKALDSYR